ncbi:MAG TPA: hypothetical protein VKZ41_12205 [Gemmatimonadales bacterium]|nr:hypothetical protein [Gemmatimonadales bacterium]
MAEIRVEERKRGTGWLWMLVLLLAVIAAVWYFSTMNGAERGATDQGTTVPMDSVSFSPDAQVPPPIRSA